jgi:hypothetical protein
MMNLRDFLSEDDQELKDEVPQDNKDAGEDLAPEATPDENQELNDDLENQDPNHMGVLRTVPNAHLVYKRQNGDSTFDELWIFNAQQKIQDDIKIRKEILSGTDIDDGNTTSEDGSQEYTLYSVGDVQMLSVTGLPQ